MLLDARELPAGQVLDADLCIIGGGVAGITLAREFRQGPHRVVLLEGGGLVNDHATQDLYRGRTTGQPHPPLDSCRQRFLGGSSNAWGGWLRPLEAIDFERRDWIAYSGWPIGAADLAPYFERAHQVLETPVPEYYAPAEELLHRHGVLPLDPAQVITGFYHYSPPTRFGEAYRAELEQSATIQLLLHANAVELLIEPESDRLSGVAVATLDGKRFEVRAKQVVLAAGGIENARLLLASNRVRLAGLGNGRDLVGRYYMEHPGVNFGFLRVARRDLDLATYDEDRIQRRGPQAGLFLPEAVVRKEKTLNIGTTFLRRTPLSLARVKAQRAGVQMWRKLLVAGQTVLGNLGRIEANTYALIVRAEQVPNPESRITLSDQRDGLGMPRVALEWRLTEQDFRAIWGNVGRLAEAFRAAKIGRIEFPKGGFEGEWRETIYTHSHHMGTTRMAADPGQGVVDANARLHEVANLFVAGSSIFPTGGYANPNLTIVQLTLRLAEHLKKVLA